MLSHLSLSLSIRTVECMCLLCKNDALAFSPVGVKLSNKISDSYHEYNSRIFGRAFFGCIQLNATSNKPTQNRKKHKVFKIKMWEVGTIFHEKVIVGNCFPTIFYKLYTNSSMTWRTEKVINRLLCLMRFCNERMECAFVGLMLFD